MTKHKVTRFLALALACIITFGTGINQVYAAEVEIFRSQMITISDYLDEESKIYLEKMTNIFDVFEINDRGILSLNTSLDNIQRRAGFTDKEMQKFNDLMNYNKAKSAGYAESNMVMPRISVRDWKVYFTYDEVMMYFSTAVTMGPAAITAALSALATTASPGVGTVIGAIAGYVVSADLMYLVLQAGINRQGIYIGLDWNGAFPNYTQGTW